MKRSEINSLIDDAVDLLRMHQIRLPPFAYWTSQEWAKKGAECHEIRCCKLGWDITDFGSGRFDEIGLIGFTMRNGHSKQAPYTGKPYAEKILIVGENQHTPMHHHVHKSEDIICRAGGNLMCRVYNVDARGALGDGDVEVSLDGVRHHVAAGHTFVLEPGTSITLTSNLYHEFWAQAASGTTIAAEVSSVNDDEADNVFLNGCARFPSIEEDVLATHLLCTEYSDDRWLTGYR